MTIIDVCGTFSSDEKCREFLERLRWPEGPQCTRCKTRELARLNAKLLYCKECDYQFSVLSGTIFHDTHLSLIKWFATTFLLCEAKKSISAHQIHRTLGMSYKTAWYLCHRIRKAVSTAERTMLSGTVEMDETFIGGVKRGIGQRRAKEAKEIVIGIRQRGGDLRFFHADDVKSGTLAKYIKENISTDVDLLVTDDFNAYQKAVGQVKHETVNHTGKEYVRYTPDVTIHTNTAESAFSLLNRAIVGSWHKISAKHLPKYLAEMEFRFNRRKNPNLFVDTLRHMITADPLTFENLTAEPDPEFDKVPA